MKTYNIRSAYYNDNAISFFDWDEKHNYPNYDRVAEHEDVTVQATTLDEAVMKFMDSQPDCYNENGNVLWIGCVVRLNAPKGQEEWMACAVPGYYMNDYDGDPIASTLAGVNRILRERYAESHQVTLAGREMRKQEQRERQMKKAKERRESKIYLGDLVDFKALGY